MSILWLSADRVLSVTVPRQVPLPQDHHGADFGADSAEDIQVRERQLAISVVVPITMLVTAKLRQ